MGTNTSPDHVNLNVKPKVSDTKTQKIINELYKGQDAKGKIGNGTMMDAIRNEKKTGRPTNSKFHTKKGKGLLVQLEDCLSSGKLSDMEKKVIRTVKEDLRKAIVGH